MATQEERDAMVEEILTETPLSLKALPIVDAWKIETAAEVISELFGKLEIVGVDAVHVGLSVTSLGMVFAGLKGEARKKCYEKLQEITVIMGDYLKEEGNDGGDSGN